VRNLVGDIEKRPRLARQIRRRKHADVQLIDNEIVKLRRDESGLVPRKVGRTDDAIVRERRRQLPRKRIALGTRSTVPDDKKHVTIAVLHAGQKAAPMSRFIDGEQIAPVSRRAIYAGVDPVRVGCPDPKGRARSGEVRAHWRVIGNLFK
jgi:hypothetical protein